MNNSANKATDKVQLIEIQADQDGQRLDNFLMRVLGGVPKSLIYRLIRTGQVRIDKGRVKPHTRIRQGSMVRVPPVRQEPQQMPRNVPQAQIDAIRRSVLYQDSDCLVINKPAGLAVHGGSGLRFGLLDVMKKIYPDQSYLELVHRLDRETSGCLLLAKNRQTLTALHEQMKQGQVVKKYFAGLKDHWQGGNRTLSAPLRKNSLKGGERMVEVDPEGKPAISHFREVQHYPGLTLMEIEIETGRTHQIRVHAAHEGHPVAGDDKYGDKAYNRRMKEKGLNRLFLHAHWLEFRLPNQPDSIQISAPLPVELNDFLNGL